MAFRRRQDKLPEWLWFFLIVPLGLVVLLLWRLRDQRFALAQIRQRGSPQGGSRYQEPDSIPIDLRRAPEPIRERGDFSELGADSEDAAMANVMAREEAGQQPSGTGERASTEVAEQGQADDLVIIEGIGKSIAGLLRAQGIRTFRQLADTPVDRLREILANARLQHLADPDTWPEQARLAAEGRMDDLEAFQHTLKGGRRA